MIHMPKFFRQDKPVTVVLPLLPLRDIVVFPHMVAPLFVGRTRSVNALADAMNNDKRLFLATQTSAGIDNPSADDISAIGTVGKVLQLLRLPDGTVKALVEGEHRGHILSFIDNEDFFQVDIEVAAEPQVPEPEQHALKRAVLEAFEEYAGMNKNISKDLVTSVNAITDLSKLADTLAAHFSFKIEDKQRIMDAIAVDERMSLLLGLIRMEIEAYEMDQRIKNRVKEQMEKTQKNYYLNEQMRAIKKEMGGDEEGAEELKELEEQIAAKELPEEAKDKVQKEFKKLRMMAPMSAEATVVRNYIEWILSLPWFEMTEISDDLDAAERILNEDHYGLEKPKERIIEYLAVQALVQKLRGPIL